MMYLIQCSDGRMYLSECSLAEDKRYLNILYLYDLSSFESHSNVQDFLNEDYASRKMLTGSIFVLTQIYIHRKYITSFLGEGAYMFKLSDEHSAMFGSEELRFNFYGHMHILN